MTRKKKLKLFFFFFSLCSGLNCEGRLLLSDRAHLVFDLHQKIDGLKEVELGRGSIGTTGKGIGPTYSSKASRSGIRVHHLFQFEEFSARFRSMVENKRKRYGNFEYDVEAELERYKELAERVRPYVIDTVPYLHEQIKAGKRVLVEGANALMLDIDFGTYPYVTSSSTAIGGVCTGLGVPPSKVSKIVGVVKAYCTRVGGGPFPTEQLNVSDSLVYARINLLFYRKLVNTFKLLVLNSVSPPAVSVVAVGWILSLLNTPP